MGVGCFTAIQIHLGFYFFVEKSSFLKKTKGEEHQILKKI
jgi:hypothetical protein